METSISYCMLLWIIPGHYASNRLCCWATILVRWFKIGIIGLPLFLLALIGVNMIREGLSSDDEPAPSLISLKHLLTLWCGNEYWCVSHWCLFCFSFRGYFIGCFHHRFNNLCHLFYWCKERSFLGKKFKSKAEIFWRFSVISHGCENPTRTWCFFKCEFSPFRL